MGDKRQHLVESSPLLLNSLTTASSNASHPSYFLEIESAPLSQSEPGSPSPAHANSSTWSSRIATFKHRLWQSKIFMNQTMVALIVASLVLIVLLLLFLSPLYTRNRKPLELTPSLPDDQDVSYFQGGLGYQDDWQDRLTILPTSLDKAARAEWVLGMQLYHSMWYPLATVHFKRARTIATHFPMAYWGEAMTYKQPLWGTEDLEAAGSVLDELSKVYSVSQSALIDPKSGSVFQKVTEEEAGYLNQVFDYFNMSYSMQEREMMQISNMEQIYTSYPTSSDACSLLGLSTLAASYYPHSNFTIEASRLIMEESLPSWPNHTGLLHYLVHSYDLGNITVAKMGLPHGYKLATVAPLSAHTTHMVSHLSVRLGNWSEVISYNNLSLVVGDKYCTRPNQQDGEGDYCSFDNRYHSLDWLAFGLAQTCRFSELSPLLSRAQQVAKSLKYPYFSTWAYKIYSYSSIISNLWFGSSSSFSLQAGGTISIWPDSSSSSPGFLTQRDSFNSDSSSLPSNLPPQIISTTTPDSDDYYLAVGETFALTALAYRYTMSLSPSLVKEINRGASFNTTASLALVQKDAQRVRAELVAISSRLSLIQLAIALRNTSVYFSVYCSQLVLMVQAMNKYHTSCLVPSALAIASSAASNESSKVAVKISSCLNSTTAGSGGWRDLMDQAVMMDQYLDPNDAPSLIPLNADELYGQMLLLLPSAIQSLSGVLNALRAKDLFNSCLDINPNRLPCLLGLARSYAAVSDVAHAKKSYGRVAAQCALGDSEWPALTETIRYLARRHQH